MLVLNRSKALELNECKPVMITFVLLSLYITLPLCLPPLTTRLFLFF